MKSVVVLSIGRRAGEVVTQQLREFLRNSVTVRLCSTGDECSFDPEEVVALLTGDQVIERPEVRALIDQGMEYIVSRRSIDYTRIQDVLALPPGTEVLLVNDFPASAKDAIEHLERVGLDHVRYHPFYPGIERYPSLPIAVTPGEIGLVPSCVRKTIDIGTRLVDITTVVELVQRLGLMDSLGDSISIRHLGDITRLVGELDQASKRITVMRDTLQILADYAPNGILYSDLSGKIILANQTMCSFLKLEPRQIQNRLIQDLISGLGACSDRSEAGTIILINGQEMVVRERTVLEGEKRVGTIHVFETTKTIQDIEHELRRRSRRSEHEARYSFEDVISAGSSMSRLLQSATRAARSDSTVLLLGESGTGKELIAQAIHRASHRALGPFVPVNFAAFPRSLLESELFGYEDGAFTGARKGGHRGLFEEAHGGTIFLDEIGDAPLEFQVSLLRVLQERQVRPVGGSRLIPVDVRVIAATNKDLSSEVREGRFRADLFYRLSVLPLRMPSLRERKEDIPLLVDHFVRRCSLGRFRNAREILSPEAQERIQSYDWPGNIRQLGNLVEFLINSHEEGSVLGLEQLPEYLWDAAPGNDRSLVLDILGQEACWLLSRLHEYGNAGRRKLAVLAGSECPALTEGRLRSLIKAMESCGLVETRPGRPGSALTERGERLFAESAGVRPQIGVGNRDSVL